MNVLQKIASKVGGGIYNYDPSDTDLVIAGRVMNDFTLVTVDPNAKRQPIQGIDSTYHTYIDLPTYTQVSVSFLRVCPDVDFMEELQDILDANKGYFEVSLKTNNRFVGTYDCYFTTDSSESISAEAGDKVYTMVAVKQDDVLFMKDSTESIF